MKPLHRFYENRQEANGESMIPVDHQPTDDLRTRIAAAIGRDDCKDYHGTADGSTCVFCVDWFLPNANAVMDALNLDISHTYKTSQGREVCIEGFWTDEVTDE